MAKDSQRHRSIGNRLGDQGPEVSRIFNLNPIVGSDDIPTFEACKSGRAGAKDIAYQGSLRIRYIKLLGQVF